jgi:hypothetical protein
VRYDDGVDGPARVWLAHMDIPGLAMSRSLGDAVAHTAGVLSEPDVTEYTLTPADELLIWASDGLWEFLSGLDVARTLQRTLAEAAAAGAAGAAAAATTAPVDGTGGADAPPPPQQHLYRRLQLRQKLLINLRLKLKKWLLKLLKKKLLAEVTLKKLYPSRQANQFLRGANLSISQVYVAFGPT